MIQFTTGLYILQELKKGITNKIYYNYTKIIVDSYNPLPLEKTITFGNVIMLLS